MSNKRYALIVRLWQVKSDDMIATQSNPADRNSLEEQSEFYPITHWRGAIQLAGDSQVCYFNSLIEMNEMIEQLVMGRRGI